MRESSDLDFSVGLHLGGVSEVDDLLFQTETVKLVKSDSDGLTDLVSGLGLVSEVDLGEVFDTNLSAEAVEEADSGSFGGVEVRDESKEETLSGGEGSGSSGDLVAELFHLGLEGYDSKAGLVVFFNHETSALEVRSGERKGDTRALSEALGDNSSNFSVRVLISDGLNDEVGGLLFSNLEGEALTNEVLAVLFGDHRLVSSLELLGSFRVGQVAFEGEGTRAGGFFALLFVKSES